MGVCVNLYVFVVLACIHERDICVNMCVCVCVHAHSFPANANNNKNG